MLCGSRSFLVVDEEQHTIVDRFEWQVARSPQSCAIRTDRGEITYQALNEAANRLAWTMLRDPSAGSAQGQSAAPAAPGDPDAPVAVLMGQGRAAIVATLGVLKAGRAFAPVDLSDPPPRVAQILRDLSAGLLVASNESATLARRMAPEGCRVINVDEIGLDQPPVNPGLSIAPDRLAYVVFSSGSTGTPRGVMHSHRNLLHDTRVFTRMMEVTPADRLALFSSATGQAIKGMIVALVNGATLVPKDVRREGAARLATWLAEHRISVMAVSAPLFRSVLNDGTGPIDLPDLRLIRLGSDRVYPSDVARFRERFLSGCALINCLSSSETGAICHVVVDRLMPLEESLVPVGHPVEGTEVLVLDENGQPAGAHCPGTIAVRSRYLSTGYWRRPDLTERAFSTDARDGRTRTYLSADQGFLRADGMLVFVGRRDHQVKIRGLLVDTSEVETALLARQDVRAAVVSGWRNRQQETQLVAYVVRATPAAPPGELRRYLEGRLAPHMLPSHFVLLDALPLLPSGKVDHQALPAPLPTRSRLDVPFAAAVTPTEHRVAAIWRQLLDLADVGIDDPFFDLGGDSLLASQVLARIVDTCGADIPLLAFFESPTIRQLAQAIDAQAHGIGHAESSPDGAARDADTIDRILARQQTMVRSWKGAQSSPGSFLFTLNETGGRPGLFWCFNAYHELTRLAAHLGPDQPVHGMRSGNRVMTYSEANVAALASYYAAEMIALQPDGPFLVGGNCQGAKTALAIATRLRQLGRSVDKLLLMELDRFDPYGGPVALLFGRDSHVNPFQPGADPEAMFRTSYPGGFTVSFIDGAHGHFFGKTNITSLAAVVRGHLADTVERVSQLPQRRLSPT